jgi:peptide/nickel transport system ATP-binding protein
MSDPLPLLEVADLIVCYRRHGSWQKVVRDVSFSIGSGEVFGMVGESGCGKSTVALQLLGYRHPASRVESGSVRFAGRDLLSLPRQELDRWRGECIGFVPQNPTTALNPAIRVGTQVAEILLVHGRSRRPSSVHDRTVELFELVGLPQPTDMAHRYPHQLSGGQQQRVCIAMALACNPQLVILDEPTTGLDATTQGQIIELLIDLRGRLGMSMFYVTHDLGVLSQIADRIGVMYAGHLVELASTANLFSEPRHPYTRGLIASIPSIDGANQNRASPLRGLLKRDELPAGCPFQPRCDFAVPSCAERPQRLEPVSPGHEVACQCWRPLVQSSRAIPGDAVPPYRLIAEPVLLTLEGCTLAYGAASGWSGRLRRPPTGFAVEDLGLSIAGSEILALVGESGSGKTTVARAISGLLAPQAGRIVLNGQPLPGLVRQRSGEQRRSIQYIFQNPDASLNPRARIGSILSRPLEIFFRLDSRSIRERVAAVLADMRLDAGYAARFPDELSGGERQRVAIARALIAEPALLLCDEVLSALDVSVQASVLTLLRRLRAEHRVAMLFIAHDLAVVREIADRVAVLYDGQLMEIGSTAAVFAPPFHPYTRSLLLAAPRLGRTGTRQPQRRLARTPSVASTGCAFARRCAWQQGRICEEAPPPWRRTAQGVAIRCHIPLDELAQQLDGISSRTT